MNLIKKRNKIGKDASFAYIILLSWFSIKHVRPFAISDMIQNRTNWREELAFWFIQRRRLVRLYKRHPSLSGKLTVEFRNARFIFFFDRIGGRFVCSGDDALRLEKDPQMMFDICCFDHKIGKSALFICARKDLWGLRRQFALLGNANARPLPGKGT